MSSLWTTSLGKLLADSSGALLACDECPCGSSATAPCECPEGLASCYRLAGYTPGVDLTGCAACENNAGAEWSGSFEALDPSVCTWILNDGAAIGGKSFGPSTGLYLDTENCLWVVEVWCTRPDYDEELIWKGTKDTGATPVGTYTRLSGAAGGCDTTTSFTVEECP